MSQISLITVKAKQSYHAHAHFVSIKTRLWFLNYWDLFAKRFILVNARARARDDLTTTDSRRNDFWQLENCGRCRRRSTGVRMRCHLLQKFRGPVRNFRTPVPNFRGPPPNIQPPAEIFEAGLQICHPPLNVVPGPEILEPQVEF